MIEFSGIEFRNVDNRLMSLKLVQLGLSEAAMFAANGEVLQPTEVLYKSPVLVERGSFRPVCFVNIDMLEAASEKFAQEPEVQGKQIIRLMELTMHKLMAEDGDVDPRDFLARADVLAASGMTVLISEYFEYERLVNYLSRCTKEKIAITMGAGSLMEIFDTKYYESLEGGILESFGRLFKTDVKLYIYPLRDLKTHEMITVENLPVAEELRFLYDYLVHNNYLVQLDNYNEQYLHIFSRDILKKIKNQDTSWEEMVPPEVAKVIKQRGFFGYKRNAMRV
jgi:hypothetical protein